MKGHLPIARLAILLLSFAHGPVWAAAALSESPTTAVPGATVVATWSGIDTPTPRDWIGFYVQGAQDEHNYDVNSWIYASSCTQVPDTSVAGKASGSCEFVLPDNLSPGVYELHCSPTTNTRGWPRATRLLLPGRSKLPRSTSTTAQRRRLITR
jgi:hypothetical protein